MSIPFVKAFFDRPTGSLQYVFHDPASLSGAIVDPVWNFYPEGAAVTTESADEILDYVQGSGIKIEWILDTHPHADHFSAAPYLGGKLKAPCAIGEKVTKVQKLWRRLYHLPADFPIDGRQYSGQSDVLSWAYARINHLCRGRRSFCARYTHVPGERHQPRGLSWRIVGRALAFDTRPARIAS